MEFEMMRNGSPLLIVEDNETDVMCLKKAFEKSGIRKPIITASNGEEALSYLKGDMPKQDQRIPNLILLDLNMPVMNGLELLEAVKSDARLKTIPVVVLTSSTSTIDMNDSYNNSVAGYIEKPMDPEAYLDIVRVLDQYWSLSYLPTIN
jgi:CheY-like chemotaxis protein